MIRGRLTGKIAFRQGFGGRVVLRVEYLWAGMQAYSRHVRENNVDWRDADALDLSHPNLRWLFDQAGAAPANSSSSAEPPPPPPTDHFLA
jgi:hypothetical protein